LFTSARELADQGAPAIAPPELGEQLDAGDRRAGLVRITRARHGRSWRPGPPGARRAARRRRSPRWPCSPPELDQVDAGTGNRAGELDQVDAGPAHAISELVSKALSTL